MTRKGSVSGIIALSIAATLASGAARAEKVIRYVPSADINVLDPVTNHSFVVTQYAFMVYDQLFAIDSAFKAHPQMVDTYTASPDGTRYQFTLRPGLKFSDGAPVTSADAIGSISRWAKNDPAGQKMLGAGMKLAAVDDKTFTMIFDAPFGSAIDVMAKPSWPLFVFPERDTRQAPTDPVTDAIGSGPFIFDKAQWRPGSKLVFERNPNYVPRSEPADGFSGGKVVKVDKVEWDIIPDSNTALSALKNGEVDAVEAVPLDLADSLAKSGDITVTVLNKLGVLAFLRLNNVQPPFNNEKARQALMYLVNQQDYMRAMIGNDKYWQTCWAYMMCNSPTGSEAGAEAYQKPDLAKAKQLLQDAGYKGEKIVLYDSTGVFGLHDEAEILAEELQSIGANVDVQTMDFNTMLSRRNNTDVTSKGGWNIEPLWSPGLDLVNPISSYLLTAPCATTGWPGWACDPKLEKLRDDWAAAAPDKKDAIAKQIQLEAVNLASSIPVGQFYQPVAYRNVLSGVLQAPYFAMWNVDKKE